MPRSVEQVEATAQTILNAAYELFAAQGYNGTSIRQVAERAGIALGGLYNHFGDKEALFVAVLQQNQPFARIQASLQGTVVTSKAELLRSLIQSIIREYHANPGSVGLLFIELVEFNGKHSQLIFDSIQQQVEGLFDYLGTLDGETHSLSAATFFRAVMGIAFGQFIGDALLSDTALATSDPDELIDILLHGLLQ